MKTHGWIPHYKVMKNWLTACVLITIGPHKMRVYHIYYGDVSIDSNLYK